jgi:DICT domain-containing protein
VREVLRLREGGSSLPAAILEVTARDGAGVESVFAQVMKRWPDLQPLVLSSEPMLAMTRAIEDEYSERHVPGVLIGSFQRTAHFRKAERRWRRLAQVSTVAIALADFRTPRLSPAGVYEVPVSREHPLTREWSLVAYVPASVRGRAAGGACLAGWEIPRTSGGRRFEVVLATDPAVAHSAAADVAGILRLSSPAAGGALTAALGPPPSPGPDGRELRSAQAVTHRLLDYLLAQR